MEHEPPKPARRLDHAGIAEKLTQVAFQGCSGGSIRRPELDEDDPTGRLHDVIVDFHNGKRRRVSSAITLRLAAWHSPSAQGRISNWIHFFLHSGPSLGSFFSVMCASPPSALRTADFSAFIGV